MKGTKKVQITYEHFGYLLDKMVEDLKKREIIYDAVHGLPRGGLPIAVHLSHFLNLPLINNITQFTSEFTPDKKLLIVDDIVDSGSTFDRLIEIANIKNINYTTAVLYYKNHSTYEPDYFVEETLDWIVFPWEEFSENPNRDKYKHLIEDNYD